MKLAVTGSFGYQDIGDEAMLTAYLDFLTGNLGFDRKNIFLFSDNPAYTSWYHHHPQENCFSSEILRASNYSLALFKRKIKQLFRLLGAGRDHWNLECETLQAAANCDALLVTGGGTLNTRTERWGESIRRMYELTGFFYRRNIPVFISGQTIGPLGICKKHDVMAYEIIRRAEVLTARDNSYSRRYIEKLGVSPKAYHEVMDDAYDLPYAGTVLPPEVEFFLASGPTAAVNVTEYTARTLKKHRFMADLCEFIIRQKKMQVVLVSHAPIDYECLQDIYSKINPDLKEKVLLPDTRRWRAAQLKKMISRCAFAVGGRYHFIVFSASCGVPFVGMCGNHYSWIKQDGLIRILEMTNGSVLTEAETWNAELIQSKIMNLKEDEAVLPNKPLTEKTSKDLFAEWLAVKGWKDSLHMFFAHKAKESLIENV
ncbi:MAG: polysaccharide pyruvyl transferase family protein [Candidatus Omnitrophica bacterium]|nr:polysaccharide pyruvyl transferase family protein [Candidatus Omnitrophota bacterium]